jgi:CTP-dependent riboflavin kinase
MSEDRNFFTIIPANIRYDKAIPVGAKFLYSDILDLINQDGFCVAGDKYFMNTCQSSQATIQRWLTYLEKNGYIDRTVKYKDGTKEIEERRIRITSNNPTLNIMYKP